MAKRSVRSPPDQALQVRTLARRYCVVFFGNTPYIHSTVPLSSQVYKRIPVSLMMGIAIPLDYHPRHFILKGALGFLVLRICPIFGSVFAFKNGSFTVSRFWCLVRFADLL